MIFNVNQKAKALYRSVCNLIDTPAVILLYHRVTTLASDPQQLAVSPENFDDQINFLKKKFTLISIDEMAEYLQQGKFPKGCVAITFDDGYADNFFEALPILENHKVHAVFYIATSNIGTSHEFWWDNLERIFLLDHPLPAALKIENNGRLHTLKTSSQAERLSAYYFLHSIIKNLEVKERDTLVNHIISLSGLTPNGRATHRVLTSAELQSLSRSPYATIGAHTHNHPKLSTCTLQDQQEEIVQSKNILEELSGKPVKHFSYPFGSKVDYTQTTIDICRTIGFTTVAANYHNQVHRWSNPFALPRMLVRNWPIHTFEKKMKSFFNH